MRIQLRVGADKSRASDVLTQRLCNARCAGGHGDVKALHAGVVELLCASYLWLPGTQREHCAAIRQRAPLALRRANTSKLVR